MSSGSLQVLHTGSEWFQVVPSGSRNQFRSPYGDEVARDGEPPKNHR